MMNCISNVTLASAIKDYIPRFSEANTAPDRKPYLPVQPEVKIKQEKRQKGEIQKVLKAPFKKVEEVPRGPNSIFSFADYLNRNSPAS
jgi:Rrf2 family iron-sulfur cluster assembly transcriptional regulator